MTHTQEVLHAECQLWQETLEQETYLPARIEAVEQLITLWRDAEESEERTDLSKLIAHVAQEAESMLRMTLALALERESEFPERTSLLARLANPEHEPDEQVRLIAARCQGAVATGETSPRVQQAVWERRLSPAPLSQVRGARPLEVPQQRPSQPTKNRSGQIQLDGATLDWELPTMVGESPAGLLKLSTHFPMLWQEMVLLQVADPTLERGCWVYVLLAQVQGDDRVGGSVVLPATVQEPIQASLVSPLHLTEEDSLFLLRSREGALLAEPDQAEFWHEWAGYLPFTLPEATPQAEQATPGLFHHLKGLIVRLMESTVPRPAGATVRFAAPVTITRIPLDGDLFASVRPRGEKWIRVAVELPDQEPGDLVLLQVLRTSQESPDFECLTALRDGACAELIVDVPRAAWYMGRSAEQEQRIRLVLLQTAEFGEELVPFLKAAWEQERTVAEARLAWRSWARQRLGDTQLASAQRDLCLQILE